MGKKIIIIAVLCLLLSGCAAPAVDQAYGPYEGITELELEIGAADIRIVSGDAVSVQTDNPYITAKQQGSRLVVREKKHIANLESSSLTITLPKGMELRDVQVKAGAGRLEADTLLCRELELELGAGEAELGKLTVSGSADIEGGAGQIVIHDGDVRDLNLEMGVGEADIVAVLRGDSEISAGIGGLYLTIPAPAQEYTLRVEAGIGRIEVDNNHVGSGTIGSGPQRIELEGGIGEIQVDFEP